MEAIEEADHRERTGVATQPCQVMGKCLLKLTRTGNPEGPTEVRRKHRMSKRRQMRSQGSQGGSTNTANAAPTR